MKPIALLLAAFGLCFTVVACSTESHGELLTALPDDFPAPDFDLMTPGGNLVRLSDYRGKPLIVNFWATWCPPCRAEMPSLERASRQLATENIGVIAINVGEDAETIRQFIEETPVSFPMPMDSDSSVIGAWQVRGLPTTFVVDPKGQLAYVATGEREWDDPALLELVRALKDGAN